jgi:hypothetical protein
MNATKIINEGVWVVENNTTLSSLTIAEGASIAAPEGKSVTMTIEGIGTATKPGSYKGDVFLTVSHNFLMPPGGLMRKSKPKAMRAAIVIEDGKYIAAKSVPAIVQGGQVTDRAAKNISIFACQDNFNGIIISGKSIYTLDGVKIDFEGNGSNDFIGLGAGIACIGDSRVTINNSDIHLKSITRCAAHVGGNSVVTFNNCRITNESPATDKMNPTWMLGFRGSNRSTQLCDNAVVYYNNCYLYTNGWGTLGVDGGEIVRMFVKDSVIELKGPRARGYGAFSIGDCFISYDHCTVNVQGYPLLIGGNEGKSDGEIINGTIINSPLYGIMMFRDGGSELKVNSKSVLNTASSTFVLKGSNSYLNIDDAILNPGNGVILQLMDNDEPGMGPARFLVPVGEVDTPIPGRDLTKADPKEDVFMTVSNMDVTGDFYNSTTNLKANCRETKPVGETADYPGMRGLIVPEDPPAPFGLPDNIKLDTSIMQGVKNLDLKFVNTKVTGVISAATAAYKDGLTVIDVRNNKELTNIKQTAQEPVNNGVIVSFDRNSVWTVTGTSYLTSLTVAEGAVIKACGCKTLIMTVDGVEKILAPGTYTGKVVLKAE